jgi:hypothetical protein
VTAKRPRTRIVAWLEHDKMSCGARVVAVDRALADIEGPVVIVAHRAGSMWLPAT